MRFSPPERYTVQSDSLLMVSSICVLLNDALYNYTGWFNIFSIVGNSDITSSSSNSKAICYRIDFYDCSLATPSAGPPRVMTI